MDKKTIGTHAGIIWNLLSNKEKWDIKKLKKETGLPEKDIYAAIGWLARENKIEFEESGGNEYYYLIIEYYF